MEKSKSKRQNERACVSVYSGKINGPILETRGRMNVETEKKKN